MAVARLQDQLRDIDLCESNRTFLGANAAREILMAVDWVSRCAEAVGETNSAVAKAQERLDRCHILTRSAPKHFGSFSRMTSICNWHIEEAEAQLNRTREAKSKADSPLRTNESHDWIAETISEIHQIDRLERVDARYPDFITSRNTMVRVSNAPSCGRGHVLVGKMVSVMVTNRNGSVVRVSFESGVCPECTGSLVYYIPVSTWSALSSHGVPACHVVNGSSSTGFDWPLESLLHQFGYNVGQTDNLSTEYRRSILKLVVGCRIFGKGEVSAFLSRRIDLAPVLLIVT